MGGSQNVILVVEPFYGESGSPAEKLPVCERITSAAQERFYI